jgi:hypothetical protein
MPKRMKESRAKGQFTPRQSETAKKPYSAPSFRMLDANAAKAILEIKAVSGDVSARAMLKSICNSKTKLGSETTEPTLRSLEKLIR